VGRSVGSQSEIADHAEIGQGYLSDIEAGRRSPSHDAVVRLAKALAVPVEWITD
jgi:transcriptional regulator with XRE-family HTH domain